MRVTFLGGAGTVTGSKYLVSSGSTHVLVDCGLFQGLKQLRLRNWRKLPIEPRKLDAILLTHAHIDHSGYLPVVCRDGFSGPIYCTEPTADLCSIMLPDSGHLQEEDARYANEKRFSKHTPALPLYTEDDANRVATRMTTVAYGSPLEIGPLSVRFQSAGHILGASSILVSDGHASVLFSGDLGRSNDLLMQPPQPPPAADYVLVESTYGDRLHPDEDPVAALGEVARRTFERKGVLLIPSFAVGRAQLILYCLYRLFESGAIERVPVYMNSPMAIDVTELYQRHADYHRLTAEQCAAAFRTAQLVKTAQESKQLNRRQGPMAIISASGMLTGGRILHHLRAFAPDPRNTLVLPGYQAPGTRGALLVGGAKSVKVHGNYVPVRASVVQLDGFSAHADQGELISWLTGCPRPPRHVFVVHGDPEASDTLRHRIGEDLGWEAEVPEHGHTYRLDGRTPPKQIEPTEQDKRSDS